MILQSDPADPRRHAVSTVDGATAYDAIEAWTTEDRVLRLRLTRDGAEALGLPRDLPLLLDPTDVDEDEVERALLEIATPYS